MTIEDADFTAALQVSGGVTQGQAKASIATVSMADMLFVRDIVAPLTLSTEQVQLSPIEGTVAGGKATGEMTTHLKDGFRYDGKLDLSGVSVKTLLQEAQSSFKVAGTLQGQMSFEGTGPMSTLKANGHAEVVDCRIEDSKMLALLATVLKVPELASPEFEDCRIEYSLANNVVTTPVVSLKGQAMEVSGQGEDEPDRLHPELRPQAGPDRSPAEQDHRASAAGGLRAPGRRLLGDRLPGLRDHGCAADRPLDRVGRAAAEDAVKGQVNKLLKRKLF